MKQLKPIIVGVSIAEIVFWVAVGAATIVLHEFAPHLEWNKIEWLRILAILPLVAIAYIMHVNWKIKASKKLADADLLDGVLSKFSPRRDTWKFLVWRMAVALTIFAVLGPKVGSKLVEVESKGSDIIIAIDVSNSMLSEDLGTSRLAIATQTVERFISKLGSDRLGLVVFAGEAFVQCPLTSDYNSLKTYLKSVSPKLINTQGTAIGGAIDVCLKAFENAPENGRSILILTDGENHEDDPVAAASKANKSGVTVHVLGIATPEGGPIPKFNIRGEQIGFIQASDGKPVVSKLDESSLIATSQAGGGLFTRANKSFVNINPTIEAFNKTLKIATTDVRYTDYDHRYQILLLLSLVLIILEVLIPHPTKSE
jgi:Ca-activated chloride channel family protein